MADNLDGANSFRLRTLCAVNGIASFIIAKLRAGQQLAGGRCSCLIRNILLASARRSCHDLNRLLKRVSSDFSSFWTRPGMRTESRKTSIVSFRTGYGDRPKHCRNATSFRRLPSAATLGRPQTPFNCNVVAKTSCICVWVSRCSRF